MMTFQYRAVSLDGVKVSGVIKAYNEYEAVAELRKSCSVVTRITEIKDSEKPKDLFPAKLKDKDLAMICSQFAIVLHSGLPLVKAVKMVSDQVEDKTLREILQKSCEDIDAGFTMAQSLERNGEGKLPPTFIETVRAGEEAGTLDQCFERLHDYYDKTSKAKGKISGALTYPIIVIGVAIVVFVIIMVKAVPMFTSTFADLGVELPFVTKALVAVSDFFIGWWWLMAIIVLLAFIAFRVYTGKPEGRLNFDTWRLLKAPGHGLSLMNASSQFASTLGTMLGAGLNLMQALTVCSEVVTNERYREGVKKLQKGVEQGQHMVDCMRKDPIFPDMMTEMTGVGEESGTLESTLDVVGDYYTNEANLKSDRLLAVMQPAITIVLALMTVVLLMAVYLPIFGMYGSM